MAAWPGQPREKILIIRLHCAERMYAKIICPCSAAQQHRRSSTPVRLRTLTWTRIVAPLAGYACDTGTASVNQSEPRAHVLHHSEWSIFRPDGVMVCSLWVWAEVHLSSSCEGQIGSGAFLGSSVDHGVYPRLYGCSLLQDTFSGRLNDVRLRRKAKQAGRDA